MNGQSSQWICFTISYDSSIDEEVD